MGTTKVGIYRSYYGPVPVDQAGQPLPKSQWLNKRPFSWVVRWYEGERHRSRRFAGHGAALDFDAKQRAAKERAEALRHLADRTGVDDARWKANSIGVARGVIGVKLHVSSTTASPPTSCAPPTSAASTASPTPGPATARTPSTTQIA